MQSTENTKLTPRSWPQSSLTSSLSIKLTGVLTLVCKLRFLEHPISRAGFQMLTSVLDPTFTLSSDGYYRSLLAKVSMVEKSCISLSYLESLPRYMPRGRRPSSSTLSKRSLSLLALLWMDGPSTTMVIWAQ